MEHIRHVRGFREAYPRPNFVRENYTLLNGEWGFLYDDGNLGKAKGFYKRIPNEIRSITVPFAYQTKSSGIGEEGYHPVVWYFLKRELHRPAKGNDLLLNFMAVDYKAEIYVNGMLCGTHEGGFSSFQIDITGSVKNGENLIAVRVEDDNANDRPRGKQSWREKPWGCWYTPFSGIYQSVFIEEVPHTRIKSLRFTPSKGGETAVADYEIENPVQNMVLSLDVSFKGKPIGTFSAASSQSKGRISVSTKTDEGSDFNRGLWSPQSPELYEVRAILKAGNGSDAVDTYFGVRFFETRNNAFLLNRNPVFLSMVMDQGFLPDSGPTYKDMGEIMREVTLIKSLGFNGVRMHQKIEDDRFYYACDVVGLFCSLEMPSPYSFGDNTVRSLLREWPEAVLGHYNHPSIVMYMPINESWGVPDIDSRKNEQELSLALYHATKALDETRIVISNDGWEHTLSDAITLHNYAQNPAELADFYSDIDIITQNKGLPKYSQTRLTFANGYNYQGQPIFLDEIGGIGYSVKEGAWGYGVVNDEDSFAERLKGILDAARTNKSVAGYCLTQLTDTYSEQNGILDADRKPKIPLEKLTKIITGENS